MRQDRGHASADIVTADERHLADANTSNIGNRVVRAGREDARFDVKVSRAGPRVGRLGGECSGSGKLGNQAGKREEDTNHGPSMCDSKVRSETYRLARIVAGGHARRAGR